MAWSIKGALADTFWYLAFVFAAIAIFSGFDLPLLFITIAVGFIFTGLIVAWDIRNLIRFSKGDEGFRDWFLKAGLEDLEKLYRMRTRPLD